MIYQLINSLQTVALLLTSNAALAQDAAEHAPRANEFVSWAALMFFTFANGGGGW